MSSSRLLHDFNDLATEIIEDILGRVVGLLISDRRVSWNAFVALREALCLICSRWKEVIFGSARFWTMVVVHPYSNTTHTVKQLSRAKQAPLSLFFDLVTERSPCRYKFERFVTPFAITTYRTPTFRNVTPEGFRAGVLPLFMGSFGQVSVLEVVGEHAEDLQLILDALSEYPALALVQAMFRLSRHNGDTRTSTRTFAKWTALRDLSLQHVIPFEGASQAIYDNLTTLRLFYLTDVLWEALGAALLRMSRLVMLQLVEVECATFNDERTIVLPAVTHLVLAYRKTASLQMVSAMVMPVLQSIRVSTNGCSIGHTARLCEHLLRTVAFVDLSVDVNDMEALAEMLPLLTNATDIDLRRCSPAVLATFMRLLSDADFALRHLKLVIFFCDTNEETATTILNMLRYPRFSTGCRLVGGLAGTGRWDRNRMVEWHLDHTGEAYHTAFEEPERAHAIQPHMQLSW